MPIQTHISNEQQHPNTSDLFLKKNCFWLFSVRCNIFIAAHDLSSPERNMGSQFPDWDGT